MLTRGIDRGDGGGIEAGGFQVGEQGFERGDEQARRLFGFARLARRHHHGVVLEAEAKQARIIAIRQRAAPKDFARLAMQQDATQALGTGVDAEDGSGAWTHCSSFEMFVRKCRRSRQGWRKTNAGLSNSDDTTSSRILPSLDRYLSSAQFKLHPVYSAIRDKRNRRLRIDLQAIQPQRFYTFANARRILHVDVICVAAKTPSRRKPRPVFRNTGIDT